MRILLVSQYFWPEQFRINDLAQGLQARGHLVTVLTTIPNYPDGKASEGYRCWWRKRHDAYQGIPVCRVPLFLRRQGRGWQLALNYLSFLIWAVLLGPWMLRGQCFDQVLVFAPSPITAAVPAIWLGRIKRAPVWLWVQDLWPESLSAAGDIRSPVILRPVGALVRWIYRHCDRILIQSRGFESSVLANGGKPEQVRYLPNWAEGFYRQVNVEADAPERDVWPEGFRIVFAGNMGEAQSLETIVGAAALLRDHADIQWVMIGDGRRRQWLQDEVRRQGLDEHFHLLGRKPAEAMPRYFALADALLVTLRDEPAFALTIPSKVQSYFACGRPVLAALNGEGAEVIRRAEAGLVAPAEDANALAEVVLQLFRMSPETRAAMGLRGRTYFEKEFDADRLITRLEGWMGELKGERCES